LSDERPSEEHQAAHQRDAEKEIDRDDGHQPAPSVRCEGVYRCGQHECEHPRQRKKQQRWEERSNDLHGNPDQDQRN
jgi:hypothetical protein